MTVRIYHCKLESLAVNLLCLINLILPALCTAVEGGSPTAVQESGSR